MSTPGGVKSPTQQCLTSLLLILKIFGLLPTNLDLSGVARLVNYINPVVQFSLILGGFYLSHHEVADMRASSLGSTLISYTILELLLTVFSLVQAVTKTKYIEKVGRTLDEVNIQLTHLEENPRHLPLSEQSQCTFKCIKLLGVFFFSYLVDAFLVYYILDIPLLSLLSLSYWVHLRFLLLSLPLFSLLLLIQSRYSRLNHKLALRLAFTSADIFHILPHPSFISHRQYKRIALVHNSLSECCAILNATFSPLVCLLLTHHVVLGVLSLYWLSVQSILYYEGGEWRNMYVYIALVALLNVKICVHTWYLLIEYSTTQALNEETVILLNKLFIKNALTKVNQELRHLRDQLTRHSISFSPYGLFQLDLHFFYTFITLIITYWVILVQFQV